MDNYNDKYNRDTDTILYERPEKETDYFKFLIDWQNHIQTNYSDHANQSSVTPFKGWSIYDNPI